MESVPLAPGLVVAGKYSLVRPLARGAMGEVWVATHTTLGGELAVKFLSRDPSHEGEDPATAMARFRFEAQVAARLSRKTRHIVAVTDYGEEWGYAYLVMELVEGESLEACMRRCGRMSPAELAPIVGQIAKGLAHAHAEGVFHRDLKPANVLLARDEDDGLLVKILDFGIAKAARSHKVAQHETGHSTEVGIVLGTPNYMSPEQARGLATLDHRCDLWALAVSTFEALTGALPYDGETTADLLVNVCSAEPLPLTRFRPDLPAELDELFSRAFAANVGDRFQDAPSFAAAFSAIAERVGSESHAGLAARSGAEPPVPPPPSPPAPALASSSTSDSIAERGVSGPIQVPLERPRRAGLLVLAGAAVVAVIVIAARMSSRSPVDEPRAAARPPTEAPAATSQIVEPPSIPPSEAPSAAASAAPTTSAAPSAVSKQTKLPKKAPPAKVQPAPQPQPVAAPAPPPPPKPVDKGEIF